ncbi:MAG TPA: SapC family protein [Caulobacteraceae bacterium]|nr:SapC family protein [Caulobacteraceae bacterium]
MTDTADFAQAQLTGEVLFYSRPEPLSKETHGALGLKPTENPYAFTAATHLVPVMVTEFAPTALCYPIIFVGEQKSPVAVLGVNANENLFVDAHGAYAPDSYLPAYIRRYPFVLANDAEAQRMIVCIDRNAPMISDKPEFPFFLNGELSEYTKNAVEFCNNFESEAQRTQSFVALLTELDLFETKKAFFSPPPINGVAQEPQVVAEYQGVSEDKLNALPPAKFAELRDNGALAQIYAHLVSLLGWDRLIVKAMLRPRRPEAANA